MREVADYDDVLGYLKNKLLQRKMQLAEASVRGNVKDFAEYKEICGQVRGLEFAESILVDLADRLKEGTDE